MTADRPHPSFPPLPHGVAEADVADAVSPPRLLTADRREHLARVESLLAADPAWQPLLTDLRAHAALLAQPAAPLSIPTDLARGVESRLNELALQELLAAEQAASAPIPISKVQFGPSRSWRSILTSTPARGLAVAACLVLVVGGGYFLTQSVRNAWPGQSRTTIAHNDAFTDFNNPAFERSPVRSDDALSTLAGATLDSAGTLADSRTDPASDPAPTETLALARALDATDAAVESDASPTITPERALALAAEGRLAIRVTTAQPERMTHRLNGLARDPSGPLKRIRPESTLASAYTSLMAPRHLDHAPTTGASPSAPTRSNTPEQLAEGTSPTDPAAPTRTRTQPDARGGHALPPSPLFTSPTQRWVSVEALYEISLPADAEAFDRIAAALRRQSAAIDGEPATTTIITGVELIELDEPARADDPLSLDPRDVLWWTGSTPGERWLNRLRIPVVVETIR
ncbi:MAG: hypothetical protein KF768_14290 [Phycisphaeraceae bacterium]|nr:hypothetical protein [Phycisphaeraceae bacterium]